MNGNSGPKQPQAMPQIVGWNIDALYVHVPFCFHKCHYCDFYSIVDDRPDRQTALVEGLLAEARAKSQQYRPNPGCTVFIGGGTPTYLPPEPWRRLLGGLAEAGWLPGGEFTVEANPETVTAELLDVLAGGGVNRLSIGAQSFNPTHLKTLERWHDPASVGRAVALARQAGFRELNLDLIFAIPGQTLDDLDRDLDALLALEPEHLACYNLTFETGTALHQRMVAGDIAPLGEDEQRAFYERVIDRLDGAGYEQYEISNWARRDASSSPSPHRCLHNLVYWRGGDWLGIGPAAASSVGGRRWRNAPHLGRYLASPAQPPVVDVEQLASADAAGEAIMMAIRQIDGIDRDWLTARLAADDPRWSRFEQFVEMGLLAWRDDRLALTRAGLFVADGIAGELL